MDELGRHGRSLSWEIVFAGGREVNEKGAAGVPGAIAPSTNFAPSLGTPFGGWTKNPVARHAASLSPHPCSSWSAG